MADKIPAIRVTDPQSRDSVPDPTSPAHAPGQAGGFDYYGAGGGGRAGGGRGSGSMSGAGRGASPRESTPTRPATSSGLPTPGKLLRSLSGSMTNNEHTTNGDDTPQSPIDPLSQHILRRAHTPQTQNLSLLRPATSSAASGTSDERDDRDPDRERDGDAASVHVLSPPAKEKKKGASFLGRLLGNKKKDASDDNVTDDAASEYSSLRPEGMEAHPFSQPVDNIEFNPRQPRPPEYIRVRARNTNEKDFDHLFLAQELHTTPATPSASQTTSQTDATIWAMQFSRDGKYMAAAGQDKIIRIWQVIATSDDRRAHAQESDFGDSEHGHHRLSAPVFRGKPIREYDGHTSTILDLSWSKNNFLLSSSMDKTVRLWHVSRDECLCTFKHNDFVTSIAFHPRDDRFFLAGSLDSKLRLWSIPDKTVAYWNQLPDMITAVAFTPDGKYAMAGCFTGLCMFYETEGLKYQNQIHVRSTHGKNAKGSKITGIQAFQHPHVSGGDTKLLISSNDSRIRMYNFRDKSMDIKFKGNVNDSSQIRASVSDDVRYIACGSEDRKVYIWPMNAGDGDKRQKRPMEMFDASNTIVTCVSIAPAKTRHLLGKSEDPIYDICNPPPVMLMSSAERAESRASSRAPTEDGHETELKPQKRPEESPAYIARSTHSEGNIIVTADFSGRIKVFRQDCAWAKRKADNWETSSVFSKRMGSSKLGRTASIATKGSSRSLRSSHGAKEGPTDRILSWRQAISGGTSVKNGSIRSQSPRKSNGTIPPRPDSKSSMGPPPTPVSKQQQKQNDDSNNNNNNGTSETTNELARDDEDNPLALQGDQSMLYWKLALNAARSHVTSHHDHRNSPDTSPKQTPNSKTPPSGLAPPLQRNQTAVSKLSIEQGSSVEDSDSDAASFKDALQDRGAEDEVVCQRCGGTNFRASRGGGGGGGRGKQGGGGNSLVCSRCGTLA